MGLARASCHLGLTPSCETCRCDGQGEGEEDAHEASAEEGLEASHGVAGMKVGGLVKWWVWCRWCNVDGQQGAKTSGMLWLLKRNPSEQTCVTLGAGQLALGQRARGHRPHAQQCIARARAGETHKTLALSLFALRLPFLPPPDPPLVPLPRPPGGSQRESAMCRKRTRNKKIKTSHPLDAWPFPTCREMANAPLGQACKQQHCLECGHPAHNYRSGPACVCITLWYSGLLVLCPTCVQRNPALASF